MSSITASIATLLPSASLHGHGHRRGASAGSSSTTSIGGSNSIGQLPVGVSSSLFSGLVQSFEQAIGSQSTSAVGGVSATAGPSLTTGQQQELQAFQHSLVQALKQDGLSGNGSGNVVSSLQTLIQQLGPGGKDTAATETLTSTFQNLVNGVGAAATASPAASKSGLQSFLNNLLQNLQTSGVQSLSSTGNHVNTQV